MISDQPKSSLLLPEISQTGNERIIYKSHQEKTSTQLANIFKNHEFSDVTFVIENERLLCHKVILSSRCDYFDNMFKSGLTDSNVIEITTMPYDIFYAIIKFIYMGEVEFPLFNDEFPRKLLETADMMVFADIKEVICEYFINKLTPLNCLGFYHMAITYQATFLQETAFKYALQNFEFVKEGKEFLECSSGILIDYLGHHDVNASSEEEICISVLKWFMYNPSERTCQIADVLAVLRLTTLTTAFLQLNLLSNSNICENKDAVDLLQAALYHILFLKPIPLKMKTQFPRTKTDIVTGLAVFWHNNPDEQYAYSYTSYGTQKTTIPKTKVSLFAFSDVNKLDFVKSQCCENTVGNDGKAKIFSVGNICVIDHNTVINCSITGNKYAYSNNGVCKYEVPSNKWIHLSSFSPVTNEYLFPVVGDSKQVYGIMYGCSSKNYLSATEENIKLQSLMRYSFDKNEWKEFCKFDSMFSNKENFTTLAHGNFLFMFGVSLQQSDRNFTGIVAVNMHSYKAFVLELKLPEVVEHMQSLVYREKVVIAGNDKLIIYKLSTLYTEAERMEYGNIKVGTTSIQSECCANYNSDGQIVKNELEETVNEQEEPIVHSFQWNFRNRTFLQLDNQLILIGGKSVKDPTKACQSVFARNLDDVIVGKWSSKSSKVGKLPDEIVIGGIDAVAVVRFYRTQKVD